jgi:hypothetical protein
MCFFGNCTAPTRARKIVRRCFEPPAHQNALHDPHISLDAKTQVLRNVSRHAYYGNCIGPTRERKRMHRCFTARVHRKALCGPLILLDAKPQVQHNVSRCAFYENRIGPTQAWKIVHDIAHSGCIGMHYVSQCAFFGNRTAPTRARKIAHQHFEPPAHQNALYDPQISLDVKTQVRRNVSRLASYGNNTRPT